MPRLNLVERQNRFYQAAFDEKRVGMALNIKHPDDTRLPRGLAALAGESLSGAVTAALRDRLSTVQRKTERAGLMAGIHQIQEFVASLPDRDDRTPEEILGYDDFGLPR